VAGLVIAAGGCALFYPAANSGYALFLLGFFVLAAGITILQVAANPYVTVLGDPRTASSRLSLTQAFNSVGTTIAPTLGGILILSASAYGASQAASVQRPYLTLAGALLLLALVFAFARLPKIEHADDGVQPGSAVRSSLLAHPHLLMGTIGIFLYVGGEVSIGSFLINFFGEPNIAALTPADAAPYVSYYWGGAMVGRFIGFLVMRYVSPGKALAFNAAVSIALVMVAVFGHGQQAMWALIGVGLFNSIMFPTIFSMALYRLGKFTGQASGILCMAIVGGAVVPFVQGMLADAIGLQWSFLVPAACYAFILYFGLQFAGLYNKGANA
jgi:FHS family L-fucose permease-like MFS transporter